MKKSPFLIVTLLLLTGCAHQQFGYSSEEEYANKYVSDAEPSYVGGYGSGGFYRYDFVRDCYDYYLDPIPYRFRQAFPCSYGGRQSNGLRFYAYSPARPSISSRQIVHLPSRRPQHPRSVTRRSTGSARGSSSAAAGHSSHSSSGSHSGSSHSSHR